MPPPPPPPPPPPQKTSNPWLWGCLGCGGAALVILLLGVGCLAIIGNSAEEALKETKENSSTSLSDSDTADAGDKPGTEEAAEDSEVKLEAERTDFTPSALHTGGDFTSVKVTVTNDSDENVDVNPFYFSITDTDGTKRDASKGIIEEANSIDTVTLAPGENVTGAITAEGSFTPASVTLDVLLGITVKADVQ
nr:DUF4352 domain-containing protein [Nocardiopsis mwathae]